MAVEFRGRQLLYEDLIPERRAKSLLRLRTDGDEATVIYQLLQVTTDQSLCREFMARPP